MLANTFASSTADGWTSGIRHRLGGQIVNPSFGEPFGQPVEDGGSIGISCGRFRFIGQFGEKRDRQMFEIGRLDSVAFVELIYKSLGNVQGHFHQEG